MAILLIRPLAFAASLARSPLRPAERAYVGWFGVRGVGSVYHATAVLGAGVLAPDEDELVIWTVIAVVIVSIVVHGVTGAPLTPPPARRAGVRGQSGDGGGRGSLDHDPAVGGPR